MELAIFALVLVVVIFSIAYSYSYGRLSRIAARCSDIQRQLTDVKENVRGLSRRPQDTRDFWNQFVCGCGHHYAYHERSDGYAGECEHAVPLERAMLADAIGQRFKDMLRIERPCRCQGYVGPLPPVDTLLASPDRLDLEPVRLLDGTMIYPTVDRLD